MATELKRFPVDSQEQAFELITKLSQKYAMQQDANRHQFHVSNERYSAYYDTEENVVKMEAIHPGITREQIEEFLMEFPPFF